jgi:hypothetical protein
MAKRKVNIPLTFGVHGGDIDKKHAPFGFLKSCKNLRMRERGRLGTRKGYAPLTMTTAAGTLRAFDLHEFKGRAIALGSDKGDATITDLYEYTGLATGAWRGTDDYEHRVMLNPFTNPRERAGILQIEGGLDEVDGALSTGHVGLCYRQFGGIDVFAVVVDKTTDQVVLMENTSRNGGGGCFSGINGAVRFALRAVGARFYCLAQIADNSVRLAHFEPGVHARFTTIATPRSATTSLSAFDLAAVTRPSTAYKVVAAYAHLTDVTIQAYSAAGVAGTTITFTAAANVIHLQVEADASSDTLGIYYVETPTTGKIRTYGLTSGLLLAGPTATTVGASGSIGRQFAQGAIGESLAVGVNNATDDTVVQIFSVAAHAVVDTLTIKNVALRSRIGNAQTANHDIAVVFSGLVAPELPGLDQATNALFYATPNVQHMAARDFVSARDPVFFTNMAARVAPTDVATAIAWVATRDAGVETGGGLPVLTLMDCFATDRRQSANYGGLMYLSGGSVAVYDGRVAGELGFAEAPGITAASSSSSGGSLTPGATYYYACHWEIVLADGSLMVSPVSIGGNRDESITDQATSVTLGASDNRASITVTGPHSVRIAAADALFGATVTVVLSRTQWVALSTTAVLLGTRDFGQTPAAPGNFSGLTLQIKVDGGSTQTVTFGATDDAASELAAAINTQTTGLVASVVGDAIFLESDSEGSSASVLIVGGTTTAAGVGFIGFVPGDTAAGETTGAPASVLRRVATKSFYKLLLNGSTVTFTDTLSDTDLGDNEPIYTQGDRGVLSGPLEQHAARGCAFITATESRLLTGGLARAYEAQVSREAFISEPYSFSEFSSFFAKASGPIMGVESLDQTKLLFTSDIVLALPGEGPDDLGGSGLGSPLQITSPGGLRTLGWRSFLKVPEGLFFQMSDDKLMLLPRGAQSPVWAGEALANTLTSYPAISGATRSRRDNSAIFSLTSATDGRLALLDFRIGEWFIDTPPLQASSGIDAVIETDDGVAYLSGGVVYRQTATFADGTSTPISTEVETQPIYPFGVGGHGQVYEALFVGELEGVSDLTLSVSLDDGLTYTALTTQSCTGTLGSTVKKAWTLPECVCGSVMFKLTKSGAAVNGGIIYNDLTLLVEDQPGLELLPAADYG